MRKIQEIKSSKCRSGKKRFKSSDHAKEVLRWIRYQGSSSEKYPVRYYTCGLCKGYHLTSQEKVAQ
jgi:hypothetical protein